jgi:glycosyltransferase involved in cell wall biosynthesis
VVSTRCGGPLDIIDEGVNGHLVNVGDTVALADKTLKVLTLSDTDWLSMSEAAHETALRFTWDDATDLFELALVRAIERTERGEFKVDLPEHQI